jgi:hypothetical protein
MTRRRRILLSAGIFAVVIGVALGVFAVLPPRGGVTKTNFDRVEIGMKKVEVEAIFGEQGLAVESNQPQDFLFYWRGDDGATATVVFFDGAVIQVFWADSTETISDKLRRWLHLAE